MQVHDTISSNRINGLNINNDSYAQAQQQFEHEAGEHFYQEDNPNYSGYDEPQFYEDYPADY